MNNPHPYGILEDEAHEGTSRRWFRPEIASYSRLSVRSGRSLFRKMAKLLNHLAARLRALVVNRREAERCEAELEAQVEARLLLSISLAQGEERATDASRPSKLIGSTCNLSETGLAIVLPSLRIGSTLITEETCTLRIVLDIYPAGLIEMDAKPVHHRRLEEKEARAGHLVGVHITGMNETDRIRYLAYLSTLERRGPIPARAV